MSRSGIPLPSNRWRSALLALGRSAVIGRPASLVITRSASLAIARSASLAIARSASLAIALALLLAGCRGAPDPASLKPRPGFPVVFVLVDAMRADRALATSHGQLLTPSLAALARDGVTFRHAYSSAPKTIPSVPQIFTSRLFPDLHHETSMLTLLEKDGYETGAFIHNPYVTKWVGRLSPTFDRIEGGDFDATALTDAAISWLSGRKSDRVAMYVHYLDVHVPLKPPPDLARRFVDESYRGPIGLEFADIAGAWAGRYGDEDHRRIADLYDAAVAGTDVQIGRLMGALREAGLYDDALVIVTADHGEELWDHGGYFHGHSLYDELLHVPLIVKFPGRWAAGRTVDGLARSIDLVPTIDDLLRRASGSADAPGEGEGASLVPLVAGAGVPRSLTATVSRLDERSPPLVAVRSDKAKLILDMRDGSEQLYDLGRDPAERDNLVADASSAALLGTMRASMQQALRPLRDSGIHVRLSNPTSSPVSYRLAVGLRPLAPFVDLARFDLERGDVLAENPRADGMTATGVLAPGDEDEIRFGVLAGDGTVVATLTTGGAPAQSCVQGETSCTPVADTKLELPLERLRAGAATARPEETMEARCGKPETGVVQACWWMLASESAPIAPVLSPAEKERLHALGYAE